MDRTRPSAGQVLHEAAGRGLASRAPRRSPTRDAPESGPHRPTFADAAAEFLRYCEQDRGCKPSTLRDYRSTLEAHLLPAFGEAPVESISPEAIDRWRSSLTGLSSRTKHKLLVVMQA